MISTLNFILFFCLFALTIAQNEPQPTEAAAEPVSTEAADSDDGALEMCSEYEFPDKDFAQDDVTKVYTDVATLTAGPFFDNNMTKYATVFGVRIVAETGVEDDKITHLAKILAQFLDNNQDGTVDFEETAQILQDRKATLFLVSDPTLPEKLLSSENGEGFPAPLKECPFAFDFEVADRIKLEKTEEEDCETSTGASDRSLGFVSDHIVGRSWPMFMTHGADTEEYTALQKLFDESVENGSFDMDAAGCPEDDLEYCGFVMFASWSATSYLNVDTCWCSDTGAWKFCTADAMKESNPELFEFMKNTLPNVPDGSYIPQ